MSKLVQADRVRIVCFALMALGSILVLFAAWQYLSADRELQTNLAEVIRSGQLNVNPQTSSEAQGLVGADIARRDLLARQFNAMMFGGGGLVLLSLGWPGLNLARNLRNREFLVSSTEETR